jgi:outer membrane protein assembly factor BamB
MTNGERKQEPVIVGPPPGGVVPAAAAGPKRPRGRRWVRSLLEVAGLLTVAAAVAGAVLYALSTRPGRHLMGRLGFGVDAPSWTAAETSPRFSSDTQRIERLKAATLLADGPPAYGWPQWRGPRRDGASGERILTDWPAGGLPRLWKAKGGVGYSSFAVGGGRVFTLLQPEGGKEEAVVCWDAETGQERWRHAYPCDFTGSGYPGPRSTPTLDGDRLYTVGSAGKLLCLRPESGDVLWECDLLDRFKVGKQPQAWGFSFSPLVEGGLLLAQPGGPGGGSVAALDKASGQPAWSALDDPAGYSSPVAATLGGVRQILVFTGAAMVGLTPDGQELWRYPWLTSNGVNAATPVHFAAREGDRERDYVFITSGYGRGCALLEVEPEGGGRFAARPVYEGNQMCCQYSSPVLHGRHLYGFNESALTCLDVRTGEERWKKSGYGKGSVLLADGHLLVLGDQGHLGLVEATPEEYREKAKARPLRGRAWTMPALAGGRLYLRDDEEVVCLDLRPK